MAYVRESFGEANTQSRRESFYFIVPGWCNQSVDGERIEAEVEYEHLEDMIKALKDLRDNDPRYEKWKNEKEQGPDEIPERFQEPEKREEGDEWLVELEDGKVGAVRSTPVQWDSERATWSAGPFDTVEKAIEYMEDKNG